jgi:membrane-associated protease RseP (regulator of RpoE activity)
VPVTIRRFGPAFPRRRAHSRHQSWSRRPAYSLTILLILGCHEFGHYAACRYYDVDASLPFFLPAPLPLTGTLGAFIRIREPIPTKKMLFDIGIAGPIAGFRGSARTRPRSVALERDRAADPLPPLTLELGEPLL